jgi:hypothetical protein
MHDFTQVSGSHDVEAEDLESGKAAQAASDADVVEVMSHDDDDDDDDDLEDEKAAQTWLMAVKDGDIVQVMKAAYSSLMSMSALMIYIQT